MLNNEGAVGPFHIKRFHNLFKKGAIYMARIDLVGGTRLQQTSNERKLDLISNNTYASSTSKKNPAASFLKDIPTPMRIVNPELLARDGKVTVINTTKSTSTFFDIKYFDTVDDAVAYMDLSENADQEFTIVFSGDMQITNRTTSLANVKRIVFGDESETIAIKYQGLAKLDSVKLGKNMKTIPALTFTSCAQLTTVELNDNLKSIGDTAFSGCEKLTTVIFNDNLQSIGNVAFAECPLESIIIPDSVTSLGTSCFAVARPTQFDTEERAEEMYAIMDATKTIKIGTGIKSIPTECFSGRRGVTSIEFPLTLESIDGAAAFQFCTNVKTLVIPPSIKQIHANAFGNMAEDLNIIVLNKEGAISNAPWGATNATITYLNIDDEKINLINMTTNELTTYDLYSDMCAYLVAHPTNMFSVVIGDDCTYTATGMNDENTAFIRRYPDMWGTQDWAVKNIVLYHMNNGFTGSLGSGWLSNMTSLQSLTLSNQLTTIEQGAFETTSIRHITIPGSVKNITQSAFRGRTVINPEMRNVSAVTLTLENGVETIDTSAFTYNAFTEITIPKSVTLIDNGAFNYNPWLENITFESGGTDLKIKNGAFAYCPSLTNVTIPDHCSSIGAGVFEACDALEEVVIGSGITEIQEDIDGGLDGAFKDCPNLKRITINKAENSITGAPWGAPEDCQVVWTG